MTAMKTARDAQPSGTRVRVGRVEVGGPQFVVAAGPCSVETEAQILRGRARGGRRRGAAPARRRLQAAHVALRVPGARRRGPAAAGRGRARPTGLPTVTEVMTAEDVPLVAALRGRAAGGRAQRAELRAAEGAGPRGEAGAAEARDLDHRRGAADVRGVRARPRQPGRHPLRARHPHLRDHAPATPST